MATNYYVDATRPDDTGAGTSEATAKQTIQAAVSLMATGDIVNVKASGVYTVGTAITFPSGLSYTAKSKVRGYTATIGDGGKATVRATAGITIFNLAGVTGGVTIQDLDIDGNNVASTTGVALAQYTSVLNCLVRRLATGVLGGSTSHASWCEVTGCTVVGLNFNGAGESSIHGCYVHDNTCTGITVLHGDAVTRCIVANNTGATSDGIATSDGYGVLIEQCTIRGNGRHGVYLPNNYVGIQPGIVNSILAGNGGYGIAFGSTPVGLVCDDFHNNAFYSNTSGPISGSVAGVGTVTLTGDPFTNASGGDFSLNNTAGAGAACRAVGYPGVFPGGLTTGYPDIGAAQHQDAGGGGTSGPTYFAF